MTDAELLVKLNLGFEEAGNIIGVSRQVLHRALTSTPVNGRRGVARSPNSTDATNAEYLNADRLLAMWRFFVEKEDDRLANLLRDEIVVRHPRISKMIAPYEEQPEDPDEFKFDEMWIFSRQPLELQSTKFRQKMGSPLKEEKKRLVYFVPSDEVATELLNVLRLAAGGSIKEVYIVVTSAVLLCPHCIVAFVSSAHGDDDVLAGVMPEPPKGMEFWKRVVRVPESFSTNVRSTLMKAGLLDANDRFKLPAKSVVGGGGLPQFKIYYPETKYRT